MAAYEKNANFSQDYKAYFIDRENQLIGLGIFDYNAAGRYVVLHFDGFRLNEVLNVAFDAYPEYCRATLIDGYMYILGQESFEVVALWNQN